MTAPLLDIRDLGKTFTMHLQGGLVIPVVSGVSLTVAAGECVVLGGPSGAGKSSILKMIYGNYRADSGAIAVVAGDETVDVASAAPRRVLALRRTTIGYVSQFLRVIPRVPALAVVAEAATAFGIDRDEAERRARDLLTLLNVPERLWSLPPATFSGGEQQRVNIARGFIADHPILLLDEPTASLDARNRAAVVELIETKKRAGTAIVGIFHDDDVRERVASRIVDVTRFAAAAA
ncbi:phosphonate C-P lyase system protein PhnL [Phreatobacter oligotrophus]|uniref:Alpha-D-ribose 1-methylphosphonate 5-triphosphate synthase subunit PhnL n=1 Tax=Phreatobacter oligotrophus TaxID=1122261 RepID=A0A2T4Z2T3_9HYPH|nr:phosphonate C-P lyase system protein PhnL [Phreatobacter oligotrophus]PTM55090.1 alpha-D-ribose 1-methylphosphonate 5-triphosphate synthase subunit PhnL [Phreatobacter oligotrophus]